MFYALLTEITKIDCEKLFLNSYNTSFLFFYGSLPKRHFKGYGEQYFVWVLLSYMIKIIKSIYEKIRILSYSVFIKTTLKFRVIEKCKKINKFFQILSIRLAVEHFPNDRQTDIVHKTTFGDLKTDKRDIDFLTHQITTVYGRK